jgi:hypothetical protein
MLTTVLRGRVNALRLETTTDDRSTAAFAFLLGTADRMTQANLTIAVPGSTVARTIAWTAADPEKYFSNAHYKNGRLRLVNKVTFDNSGMSNEELTMSWIMDLDAPVVARATR